MNDPAFPQLSTESQIRNAIYGYPLSIDRRRWEDFRNCFTDTMEADFTRAGHKAIYRGTADGWVAGIRATVEAMDGTHHQLDNLRIELAGGAAKASCSFYAIHVLGNSSGDSRYDVAGFYDFELAHHGGSWRIAKYSAAMNLRFGNPMIFKLAGRGNPGRPASKHDDGI